MQARSLHLHCCMDLSAFWLSLKKQHNADRRIMVCTCVYVVVVSLLFFIYDSKIGFWYSCVFTWIATTATTTHALSYTATATKPTYCHTSTCTLPDTHSHCPCNAQSSIHGQTWKATTKRHTTKKLRKKLSCPGGTVPWESQSQRQKKEARK